jgi:hypothetical protein
MPAPDLIQVMQLYAREGIQQWKAAPDQLKRRAQACLGTAIAENEPQAFVTLATIYNGKDADRLRFIPMPKRPKHGIERNFFIPVREYKPSGEIAVGFELFLLVSGMNCLAYRFEPAHPMPTVHNYNHVQMSQQLLRKTIPTAVPTWLPDKYPAFPLSTTNPLRVFLAMITAMHGYAGGVVAILQDIFVKAGRARETAVYLSELQAMLT